MELAIVGVSKIRRAFQNKSEKLKNGYTHCKYSDCLFWTLLPLITSARHIILNTYFQPVMFRLLHAYARLVLPLYCRKITINQPENLKLQGPLLIAANHPNSFLDGMIVTTLFKHPVYSLARGDAFKKKG